MPYSALLARPCIVSPHLSCAVLRRHSQVDRGRDSLERLTSGRPSSSQKERVDRERSGSRSRSKERKERDRASKAMEERPGYTVLVYGYLADNLARARAADADLGAPDRGSAHHG